MCRWMNKRSCCFKQERLCASPPADDLQESHALEIHNSQALSLGGLAEGIGRKSNGNRAPVVHAHLVDGQAVDALSKRPGPWRHSSSQQRSGVPPISRAFRCAMSDETLETTTERRNASEKNTLASQPLRKSVAAQHCVRWKGNDATPFVAGR